MTHRATPYGWLPLMVLLVVACSPAEQEPIAAPTTDPAVSAEVTAVFVTYRGGIQAGDADAVLESLDAGSLAEMQRIADLALEADEATVRALPAADQLLVLTYRLRPELLEGETPYADLVAAGLAGQDRSLGELGDVVQASEDVALGVVLAAGSQSETPLRWRFRLEDGRWRFDLLEAQRLVSQAIGTSAQRSGIGVDDLVAATVVDLSGEPAPTVEALYTELPEVG